MIILKHDREVNISSSDHRGHVPKSGTTAQCSRRLTLFLLLLLCVYPWASWFIWQNSARFMLADTVPQHHQQLPSSLNFITVYTHRYLLLTPLTLITTNPHHHKPSSQSAIVTTNHHHNLLSPPPTITTTCSHHHQPSPQPALTITNHHHNLLSPPPTITTNPHPVSYTHLTLPTMAVV